MLSGTPTTAPAGGRSCHMPVALAAGLAWMLLCGLASAEEGGSGHYFPGSMASFIDGVPPTETFLVRFNGLYYDGSAGVGREIPIGGLTTVGATAKTWGAGFTVLWRPPFELGGAWSYAMSSTIPLVNLDVNANVHATLGNGLTGGIARSSNTSGLGDIVLMPLMLNYNVDPDFNINARVAFYAPTGSYEVGRLANTGKNFWTTEPTVGFMYLGQKNGIEASAFVGIDLNSENSDTHYKSGSQFHIDGTLAQHLPLWRGLTGIGLTAYYYRQVSDDSGAGATLGAFRAKTVGLGPVVSYVRKIDGHDTIWELKWLHETQTENRMQGNAGWLKVVYKFK
jgi:hypothetical protein